MSIVIVRSGGAYLVRMPGDLTRYMGLRWSNDPEAREMAAKFHCSIDGQLVAIYHMGLPGYTLPYEVEWID